MTMLYSTEMQSSVSLAHEAKLIYVPAAQTSDRAR